jgi:protein SCO1/2
MPQSALARAALIFAGGMTLLAVGLAAWLLSQQPGPSRGPTASRGTALVGGPFELIDQHGRTRRDAEFRGRSMLVYFGYTFCPDICPTSLMVMTRTLQALEAADPDLAAGVVPIFVTIDPERDTVEALAAYAPHFHQRLVALTGSTAQVAAAAKAYRVFYAKAVDDSASDYLMDHSGFIYLMDPDGSYRTHFTHDATPETILQTLRRPAGS